MQNLARLVFVERAIGLYSDDHPDTQHIHACVLEVIEQSREHHQTNLLYGVGEKLYDLAAIYKDADLNNALSTYFWEWDPGDHYYFHTIVANSIDTSKEKAKDVKPFDDRVFRALEALAGYLGRDPNLAAELGDEVAKVMPKARERCDTQRAVDRTAPLPPSRPEGGGILSTLSWSSTWGLTLLGNFEGPPTLLQLFITHLAVRPSFIERLGTKSMLDTASVVLFGMDPVVRKKTLAEVKKPRPNFAAVEGVIKETSWRSRATCTFFGFLGMVNLVTHAKGAIEHLAEQDRDVPGCHALHVRHYHHGCCLHRGVGHGR